jgi:hypothetical protein
MIVIQYICFFFFQFLHIYNYKNVCKIWDSNSSVDKDSGLLGYEAL